MRMNEHCAISNHACAIKRSHREHHAGIDCRLIHFLGRVELVVKPCFFPIQCQKFADSIHLIRWIDQFISDHGRTVLIWVVVTGTSHVLVRVVVTRRRVKPLAHLTRQLLRDRVGERQGQGVRDVRAAAAL